MLEIIYCIITAIAIICHIVICGMKYQISDSSFRREDLIFIAGFGSAFILLWPLALIVAICAAPFVALFYLGRYIGTTRDFK